MIQYALRWLTATSSRKFVLVVAGMIVALGILSFVQPLYGQICDYNQYTDQEHCRSQRLVVVLLTHIWRFLDSLNGFVTAIATALLTVITIKLARLEEESGETQRSELRAYVSASPEMMALHPNGKTIDFMTTIQNHGQTPAFKTKVFSKAEVMPLPMKDNIFLDILEEARASVATYICWPARDPIAHTTRYELTEEDLAKLKAGDHGLLVFGRVEYIDSFNLEQWTDFCSALDAETFGRHLSELRQMTGKKIMSAGFYMTQFNNDASSRLPTPQGSK